MDLTAIIGLVLLVALVGGLTYLKGRPRVGLGSAFRILSRSRKARVIGAGDEVFDGVPLGVLPSSETAVPTRLATRDDAQAPVAVRFEPPQALLPEQTGMLQLALVKNEDLSAALVALVVAGHVKMTRHEIVASHGEPCVEWWLAPVRPPAEGQLRSWLFDQVSQLPPPGKLDDLKRILHREGGAARRDYADTSQHRSWYPRMNHDGGRSQLFGAYARSAEATALRYQLAGFHQFLATADGHRLRFEEGAGLFSRYLPWSVALGVTERWTQALHEAATELEPAYEERWRTDLAWISSPGLMQLTSLPLITATLSTQLADVNAAVGATTDGGDLAGGSSDLGGSVDLGSFSGSGFDGGGSG